MKKRFYFPNGTFEDREVDDYEDENIHCEDECTSEDDLDEDGPEILFTRCSPIKKIRKTDLFLMYPEGKVIACRSEGEYMLVFAEAELMSGVNEGYYDDVFSKLEWDINREYSVRFVNQIPQSTVDGSFRCMSKEEFYTGDFIDNMAGMLRKVYGVDYSNIKIYVRGIEDSSEYVVYYGMACCILSGHEKMSMGTRVMQMRYERYIEQKQEYINNATKTEEKDSSEMTKDIHEEAMNEPILPPVCYEIRRWLYKTTFEEFYADIAKEVIGQSELKKVLFYVYTYLNNIAYGRKVLNRNILITAGSGQGKTETQRALKRYFHRKENIPSLPVILTDVSSLTEAGYKGREVRQLFGEIFQEKNYSNQNGVALIFLDEIDKKVYSHSHDGGFNRAAISNLLVTLEGSIVYADKDEDPDTDKIDTSNSMFIGMGSFDFVRMDRAKARDNISFAFGNENEQNKKDHFYKISKQDIIDAGGTFELVGRFCSVVNYSKLSKEAVNQIIDKICENIANDLGYKIVITRKMRNLLHEHSSSKYGCRQLDSIIRETAVELLLDENKRRKIDELGEIKLDVPKYEIEIG